LPERVTNEFRHGQVPLKGGVPRGENITEIGDGGISSKIEDLISGEAPALDPPMNLYTDWPSADSIDFHVKIERL
jgi:hypothetical protein